MEKFSNMLLFKVLLLQDVPIISVVITVLSSVLIVTLFAFALLTCYILFLRHQYSHIPSPPLYSFFGGHLKFFNDTKKQYGEDRPFNYTVLKLHEMAGSPPVFVLFLFTSPLVVCMDAEGAKNLLTNPKYIKSFMAYKWFVNLCGERLLGKGLFTIIDNEEWKPRRKIYDPAFNRGFLKGLIPSFVKCTDSLIEKLQKSADGKTPVPMKLELSNVTLDIISKVGFSSDFSEWTPEKLGLKFVKSDGHIRSLIVSVMCGIQKQFNLLIMPYQYLHPFDARQHAEAIRAVRTIGRDCIMKRISSIERGETIPHDILSCILKTTQADYTTDIEQLVDDFMTFFIAGHETTANTLSFAVAMILQHPQVLTKLLAEIDEVLGDKDTITADDLNKLKYTEQVIQEVLRLHPPVGISMKTSPKEGIELSGYNIPGNTYITVPTNCYCRMSKYFDDPDTFDPDRFAPDKQQPSSLVYFPFGVGLRSCIGKHFAMMEAKLLLSRLFQKFTFQLPPDYELISVQRATSQPLDNVNCTLQQRKIKNY